MTNLLIQSCSDHNNSLFYLDYHSNGHTFYAIRMSAKQINKKKKRTDFLSVGQHTALISLNYRSLVSQQLL